MTSPETRKLERTVPPESAGRRLDQALAQLFPEFSRSRLQEWIRSGLALVDGARKRPRDPVQGGECIHLHPVYEIAGQPEAQEIPLTIAHEDSELLVINKPAGLVVHPGAGNRDRTLVNALLHRFPELSGIPRAGLVHRLDKDTTGLLLVARTLSAHKALVAQLAERQIHRHYAAIVVGRIIAGGSVDAPIGRHPKKRTHMAVVQRGRPAVTHYRVQQHFPAHTLLSLALESGRTHQIRVHMSHIGHPLLGDPAYGRRLHIPTGASAALEQTLRTFHRQALHACALEFEHPGTGETLRIEAPLPEDMRALLAVLGEADQKV